MVFDLNSPEFYNEDAYDKETLRIYEICNGCRLCYNLCPSFKVLFERIDELDGEVHKLEKTDKKKIVDLCYDCKLCFPKCPYTPPHHYMLDFPRLMLRGKAIEAKKGNVAMQDKLLGRTDLIGSLSTKVAPIVNWTLENRPLRVLVEKIIGIHRDRNLPKYSSVTFKKWYQKHREADHAVIKNSEAPQVVFFHTCSVNYNDTDQGKAAVQVLEKNGVNIEIPPQKCCGMPFLDGGDIDNARKNAEYNIKHLAPYVKKGYEIVTPGPTCTYMLKQEYPLLTNDPDAKLISTHTFDLMEYLAKLEKSGKLSKDFKKAQGKITYHLPCHLKAQNIGYKSRDVLELIPDTSVDVVAKCTGHDGTWSLKKDYFELSLEIGKPVFDKFKESHQTVAATDCPLAQLQIQKGSGRKPRHPIQILRDAYGLPEDPKS
ncbi:MAG: anaerobic glycerol-3-phosphate dehydrogenase subunit C [Candidatus Kryptoniota bacterium]